MKEDDRLQMIWVDEDIQIVYNFCVTGVAEEKFLSMCDILAGTLSTYAELLATPISMDISEYAPEKQTDHPDISAEDFLQIVLPGYLEISFSCNSHGLITAAYQNPNRDTISSGKSPAVPKNSGAFVLKEERR